MVVALVRNVLGLLAVLVDLRLSAADVAALSAEQQALCGARPPWSAGASILSVAGAGRLANPVPFVPQGLVLAIPVGLVFLARHAAGRNWLAPPVAGRGSEQNPVSPRPMIPPELAAGRMTERTPDPGDGRGERLARAAGPGPGIRRSRRP
ncbi:MAG: hypothetical protein U0529_10700 [Thermoanaerobaculia bacterium]